MFSAIDLVLVSSLAFALTAASFNINIKPVKEMYVQALHSSIVFTCEVTGRTDSQIKIQWFDNSRVEIQEDPSKRIYVELGSSERLVRKLYITRMENRDSGRYHCVASAGSLRQNNSVDLTIFKDITFDHVPNPQHPRIHSDALIECQVSGEPEPRVSWKYNTRTLEFDCSSTFPIHDSDKARQCAAQGNRYTKLWNGLQIRNITLADDGNYTCSAEVDAEGRFGDKMITVAVHIPPSEVEFKGNLEEVEGKNVSLTCTAKGLPPPKFEFNKDNRGKISFSTDRIIIDTDGGKLSFRPVRKEDEGLYTCGAINDVGHKSIAKKLKVLVQPKIYELKNITKSEHENAVLVCRSRGDPSPILEFHKEGNPYPYRMGSNDRDRIQVTQKAVGQLELTIGRLVPSDSANYTCVSQNVAGYHNATGTIDVHFKPRFDGDHKSQVFGWAGTRHNMTCHVHAQPVPTIKWLRYNRILENNETFVIYNSGRHSTLQIRIKETDQSWIYGDYICQATNSKGSATQPIHLNRATVPDAPVRVTNKEISPNQVLIRVDPPKDNGGVPVTGYRVEFESIVQDVSVTGNYAVEADDVRYNRWYSNFTATELSIDNLRPGTKYFFRIRAKNEVGVGIDVEHIVTTANLTNPYPIKLTSPLTSRGQDFYQVTWERPKTGGRPIKRYEFRYRKVKNDVGDPEQNAEEWVSEHAYDTPDKPILEYTLSGLAPLTDYQLQVLAVNDLGASAPNEDFYFRTPQVSPPSSACCSGVALNELFGSCCLAIRCLTLVIPTLATIWIMESAKI